MGEAENATMLVSHENRLKHLETELAVMANAFKAVLLQNAPQPATPSPPNPTPPTGQA
jgi:hypothetical protein